MSTLDDRWNEINPILTAALDMPAGDREGYVARACGDDAELRALIERLLSRATEDTTDTGPLWEAFAEELAAEGESGTSTPGGSSGGGRDAPPSLASGTIIDRYRLLEEIGRGGMSVVYSAERTDGAFDAPVALKLASHAPLDTAARARFEQERNILAELRHPHIAQLLDGGESDAGQPYLVMELIDGEPIDTYADGKHLNVDERLVLFLDAARAVQHAHRNLVVHRDIKPSNVLVDRDGRVKLLDFGIAALLDDASASAPVTRTHYRPMTPAFASPEQLRGEPVTTVSDVYQLGHLLYRLLTGCPPYRADTQDSDAWRRAITETEPARPSEVVARAAVRERLAPESASLEEIARQRRTTPGRLARALRGDLETVVLMALRKEPDRRYASALQLADDLTRFRDGLPVLAQPDTAGYRVKKFVARNRVTVSAAVLLLVLLVGFSATVAIQAQRIAAERDRARREAETAEGVTRFLIDIFRDSAPITGSTVDVRALDVVNNAASRIERELADDPIVRARVMSAIGALYYRFGENTRALPLLREATAVLERDKAEHPVPWAFAVSELTQISIEDGYTPDEAAQLAEVVDIYVDAYGAQSLEAISAKFNHATAMLWSGDFEGSRARFDVVIDEFEALEPQATTDWISVSSNIAIILSARGQLEHAKELLLTTYPLAEEIDNIPLLGKLAGELAEIYDAQNNVDELERYAREFLAHSRETFGAGSTEMSQAWRVMGSLHHARGRYGESHEAYRRAYELFDEHTAMGQGAALGADIAEVLIDAGRADEARAIADTSAAQIMSMFGRSTTLAAGARLQQARARLDLGETVAADTTFRAIDAYYTGGGRGARGHAEALEGLARVHLQAGRADSACVVLARAIEILQPTSPDGYWKMARIRGVYGRALIAVGDVQAASRELDAAWAVLRGRGDRYAREVEEARRAIADARD